VPLQRLFGQQFLNDGQLPRLICVQSLGCLNRGRVGWPGEEGQTVLDQQRRHPHRTWRVAGRGWAIGQLGRLRHQNPPFRISERQAGNVGHLHGGGLRVFTQLNIEQLGQGLVGSETKQVAVGDGSLMGQAPEFVPGHSRRNQHRVTHGPIFP